MIVEMRSGFRRVEFVSGEIGLERQDLFLAIARCKLAGPASVVGCIIRRG